MRRVTTMERVEPAGVRHYVVIHLGDHRLESEAYRTRAIALLAAAEIARLLGPPVHVEVTA